MATHSSVLAWRIPGTGEAGGAACRLWGRTESSPSTELEWETAFSIGLGAIARLEEQVWTQQVHTCLAHLLS